MRSLNILHISDSHIQKKDEKEIREIVQKMIIDINKVQSEKNINIDMICFTGDLIQRGDEAIEHEGQWKLANDILVTPLLENLNLLEDRFIFVPGNHEVDKNEIVDALECGLQVVSLDQIKGFMDRFNPIYKGRLKYFYDIVGKSGLNPTFGILGYSLQKEINGIEIGLACIDSAWRSSGKGTSERGHLYIGLKQIQELYANIKDASLKIGLLHHPVEWMEECERLEIERELSKFDIVLSGHIHETDLKQVIRRRIKTIYSTAGKLYPLDYAEGRAKDGYNGYSILNIRYDEAKCNVFFRTYYAQNRNEFDIATIICEGGEECYEIGTRADMKQLQWGLIGGISDFFHVSDKYNLINDVDTKSPKSLQQIFVSPVLAEKSEYIKENQASEVNLQDIFDQDDNIFLIGKKESGKTTILQQVGLRYSAEYSIRGIIPVYVDFKYLPKGNDKLLNSTIQFIQKNIADNESISKQKILELLLTGKLLLLFDNVEIDNSRHTSNIVEFTEKYSKNRFIFATQEDFFQSLDIKQIPKYGIDLKTIYIQYMGKAQIRELVTKWANFKKEDEIDINDVVNKIDSYCNQINFAKTPFNITIFMVLWDEDNNFIPINEGIVMENYIEVILEKLSPKEPLRCEYGFKIKQDFLSYIAHEMHLRKRTYLKRDEFNELVEYYHKKKGFRLTNSKFDILFFEKNILSYMDDYIQFTSTSFRQYFLAQYAYHNEEFLSKITKKGTRTFFKNEICFYSGLKQNCCELLEELSNDIINVIIENIELTDKLNSMQIMTEFQIDKEKLLSEIQDNRPSQEELDKISDNSIIAIKEVNFIETEKLDIEENEAEDFFGLLQIYGSIIKNAELIDNKDKISHLEYYMYGMNMLYSMMIELSERKIKELKYDELPEFIKNDLECKDEEEFEKEKPKIVDYMKIIFPVAVQNIIYENVGTPKLEIAINSLIKDKQGKAFEIFMLTFLKCDLKIASIKKLLEEYIKKEESIDVLKIVLFKLTFYYKVRFFGNNTMLDKELLYLIEQVQMKINPPQVRYIHKIKKKKEIF